jgi:hypothetical protein
VYDAPRELDDDDMEPHLVTEPRLRPVLKELMAREPLFHRPEIAKSRADFEQMTDATFWEIGASGRRYSREYVLDILDQRLANPAADVWKTKDGHCQEIAPDLFLLTYTLAQGERVTRRSSLWRRAGGSWCVLFHQGTVVQDD